MYSVVIVAAGKSTRANMSVNKVFYEINSKPLIEYTIRPFLRDASCDKIILVVSYAEMDYRKKQYENERITVISGGISRQESVYLGLKQVTSDIVLIHDGARPNLRFSLIQDILDEIALKSAATLAIPVKDTLMIVHDRMIEKPIDRAQTFQIQTPQGFYLKDILSAHEKAVLNHREYTDDASLYMTELQKDVSVVLGDEANIKATTQIDLKILEELLC